MTGGGPASACTDRLSVDVLEEAAALSNPSTGTIPPGYTNQQWREHYYYVLGKHGLTQSGNGVTSHGLRYQFLQKMYAALAGEPAPIKRAEECGPSELHREAWQRVGMIAGLSAATKGTCTSQSAALAREAWRARSRRRTLSRQ